MNPHMMFATDKQKEVNGVVVDFGEFQITVARAGGANKAYQRMLVERFKPHKRAIDNETIDTDVLEKLTIEVFSSTVVKGWSGVTDENGDALEFTTANCITLLTQLPDLFRELQDAASSIARFRKESQDGIVKKSASS